LCKQQCKEEAREINKPCSIASLVTHYKFYHAAPAQRDEDENEDADDSRLKS